jgi:hypothetical protein
MHHPALPPQAAIRPWFGAGEVAERLLDPVRIPPVAPQVTPQAIEPAPLGVMFAAYARTRHGCVCCAPEPERCACGGWIKPVSVADIADAVASHNETAEHLAWRQRRET